MGIRKRRFNVDHGDYALSRATDSYDEFLSHDWATPRLLKLVSMLILGSGLLHSSSYKLLIINRVIIKLWRSSLSLRLMQ